jgi:hypothetical protein
MNTKILLAAVCAMAACGCSTAYKVTQTPDDVYYSPGRDGTYAYVASPAESETYNDGDILMSINDPRWRLFDDYDYSYSPYAYGYNSDYYYNPYYCSYPVYNPIVITPANPVNTTPRMTNLSAYNTAHNNINQALKQDKINVQKQQKADNNSTGQTSWFGNVVRQVFAPTDENGNTNGYNNSNYNNTNNTNNNTTNTSDRNYAPASSGSGSSSGSAGDISRPARSGSH